MCSLSRRRRALLTAALGCVVGLTLTACGGSSPAPTAAVVSPPAVAPAADGAVPLPQPFAKPPLVLTDDQGRPFDLVKQTAGKPTLLYFGYTHCPDICPTTMGDIAVAVGKLSAAERARLQVVFVTTDPTRDTPQRLHQWLAAFNPQFVGLTGDFTAIQQAAKTLGIAIAKPVKQPDGSYTVTHGAEVFAFDAKDDLAHELFPSGTSAQQYAAALPRIMKGLAS
ncbi:SCO family protein [Streptacidiphilus anmyonensis]|uniref:SCO family protein n=1 Tax=Streptacidiphilus anmyonensis TaxID=405782 RepID=UPI0005AAEED2|nr:SCO family protein [Streptacidiphilus anmyonensis]